MKDLVEEEISSAEVYSGKLLKVRCDRVRLPDGNTATREYIRHPGAVVVIAMLPNGNLLMERQHRYPLHRDFLELPAGKLDPGEDPLECAKRELLEETGYVAEEWQYLATLHPCIGYADERLIYFLARNLSFSERKLDEEEFIEVFEMRLYEALDAVRRGDITDNKTVSGLFWAEKILQGEWPVS